MIAVAAEASAHWYTTAPVLSAAAIIGAIATVVVVPAGIIQVWLWFRDRNPYELAYQLLTSAPLLTGPGAARRRVSVTYDGQILSSPRVDTIRLISRGRKDIPSSFFDSDEPLRLDLGTAVLEILEASTTRIDPSTSAKTSDAIETPIPHRLSPDRTSLLIGPGLIRAGRQTTWTLLLDGPTSNLTCHNPLIDVAVHRHTTDSSAPEPIYMAVAGVVVAGMGMAAAVAAWDLAAAVVVTGMGMAAGMATIWIDRRRS